MDSLVRGAMTLRPISPDRYIVGGAYKIPSDTYNSAVFVMDTAGLPTRTFVAESPYFNNYTGMQTAIAPIDDNTFYFLAWRNMSLLGWFPYEPTEPDQLCVYKMDNDLNVLCTYVPDGFADGTYYVPTRIKTTPSRGFAILGGKKDMTNPGSNIMGWVQTFSPEECVVGTGNLEVAVPAMVYPNPGRDGFDVLLNGSGLPGGTITVHDAQGAQVAQARLSGPTGHVDCAVLPEGLYLYRITDRSGKPCTAGRWVKQ